MFTGCAVTLACLLALVSCGKSEGSKVMAAIKARFLDGQQRCLGMSGDAVGLHLSKPSNGVLLSPRTGWTSPLARPRCLREGNPPWDGTPAVQAEVDNAEAAPPWAKLPVPHASRRAPRERASPRNGAPRSCLRSNAIG